MELDLVFLGDFLWQWLICFCWDECFKLDKFQVQLFFSGASFGRSEVITQGHLPI